MVVDDEMVMRDLLYTVLTKQGYQVVTAPNGRAGLDMLAKEKPSLVILDLIMPGMNGLETFVQMRRIDPKIEAIILTGANVDDLETQARQLGISDILRKGVGVELFLKSINYVMDKRKSKQTGPESKSKGDILVVDDDSEIRFMLEKFFTRQGYTVTTAASGEAAASFASIPEGCAVAAATEPAPTAMKVTGVPSGCGLAGVANRDAPVAGDGVPIT